MRHIYYVFLSCGGTSCASLRWLNATGWLRPYCPIFQRPLHKINQFENMIWSHMNHYILYLEAPLHLWLGGSNLAPACGGQVLSGMYLSCANFSGQIKEKGWRRGLKSEGQKLGQSRATLPTEVEHAQPQKSLWHPILVKNEEKSWNGQVQSTKMCGQWKRIEHDECKEKWTKICGWKKWTWLLLICLKIKKWESWVKLGKSWVQS